MNSAKQRKIIHIDCDCFYAAVEVRDRPELKGLPVAVGGSSRTRGVLSTCNYEARAFGLHSAMSTSEALRRCPSVVLLPHRFDVYKTVSSQIHEIFKRYTQSIEPLSLDEAFLDVTDSTINQGSATLISQQIRQDIEKELGITASAGIAPNKFLAKVASDWNKPNGYFVIRPKDIDAFMLTLAVEKIPGVGKAAMKKMHALEVKTCADLQQIEPATLVAHFGKFGRRLYALSFGRDDRPVTNNRLRKSLSVEHTFSKNRSELVQGLEALKQLYPELEVRLARFLEKASLSKTPSNHSYPRICKLQLKLKFYDFTSTTIECQSMDLDRWLFEQLLIKAWARTGKAIRLLGIGVAFTYSLDRSHQLSLFSESATLKSQLAIAENNS